MKSTREDPFIKLFLSAYENFAWADAVCIKPDADDRNNQAVDQITTRKSDGKTLAIEHTIIEPFVGDKKDLATFLKAAFLEIEKDESLPVPGRWIQVFVPVGTLQNQTEESRGAIVRSVHQWIKLNRLVLPDGPSQHACSITGIPGRPSFELLLNVEMIPLQSGLIAKRGSLHVRRQQISNSLCEVIEKALRDKLPKLVSTMADKHILLLERQHMILDPKVILGEIEDRRASFPDLAGVDEIWVLDNFGYGTNFWGTYLRFALHNGGKVVRSFVFEGGKLTMKFEDGEASYQ